MVQYSPEGPLHNPYVRGMVPLDDPATDRIYSVIGFDLTLRSNNAEGVIAIAPSLFESPNPPSLPDRRSVTPGHS